MEAENRRRIEDEATKKKQAEEARRAQEEQRAKQETEAQRRAAAEVATTPAARPERHKPEKAPVARRRSGQGHALRTPGTARRRRRRRAQQEEEARQGAHRQPAA